MLLSLFWKSSEGISRSCFLELRVVSAAKLLLLQHGPKSPASASLIVDLTPRGFVLLLLLPGVGPARAAPQPVGHGVSRRHA